VGWGEDSATGTSCGEGYDRNELGLPGVQGELARAVLETGTPTVLVLVSGRPYALPELYERCPAVIEAWYPGSEGGTALGEALFGKTNPSGKLPISIPRSVGHVPCCYDHKPSGRGFYNVSGRPGAPGRDYVFAEPTAQFEFGHGLSYTKFAYAKLRVTPRRIRPDGRVTVRVDVRNAGPRAGKEVVQLYLNDVVSSVTTPLKLLKGFAKIHLKPGERKTVAFTLGPDDLALWNQEMEYVVEPGRFEVTIDRLKRSFEVMPPRG
jgi:beta-glucosidase